MVEVVTMIGIMLVIMTWLVPLLKTPGAGVEEMADDRLLIAVVVAITQEILYLIDKSSLWRLNSSDR